MSPRDIEAIVSGRDAEDPAAEPIAALVEDMRRDLLEDPAPDVAARHLAAMSDAAGEVEGPSTVTTPKARRKWMRFRGQRRLAGLAAAALLLLGAGIATAVTLPNQASDTAKDAVESAGENAEHGQDVSETARETELEGCEKGQAVAGQASSKAADQRQGPQEDPCARGEGEGASASQAGSAGSRGGEGPSVTQGGPGVSGGDGPSITQLGSGGGSGGPGGGGGGGGSEIGSGGGSGGPGGGGGGGGSELGGGSGSGGPGTTPRP